jgi:hypothetical protein
MACLTRPSYAASRVPRLGLGIRNNAIIRSGMKSILNFRHNIEKYGFKCLEFGNPQLGANFSSFVLPRHSF